MVLFKDFYPQVYLTEYQKISDPNKDAQGRGTDERWMSTFGEEIDSYAMPLIVDLQKNLVNPFTMLQQYIPYRESMMGYLKDWTWFPTLPQATRKHYLAIINRLYAIRSTITAYELMLKWIGMTGVTITETYVRGGFDSPYTFDSPVRTFDTGCQACSTYDIALTGTAANLTSNQYLALQTIIAFNEPLDTKLKNLTYNGQQIVMVAVLVWIDAQGNLNYNNDLDPGLTLGLVNGNLLISGPNASKYSINAAGDLLFTI